MPPRLRRIAALLGVAALALPAAAAAKDHADAQGQRHGPKKVKLANFLFKGVYQGAGAVAVKGGNSRVRKHGFVGEQVTFDLSGAKVFVADVNGDGTRDAADLSVGDKLVIQARLPRSAKAADAATLVARRVVDRSHPRSEDAEDDDDDADGAPPAPTAQ